MKGECFLCGIYGYGEDHHIFGGNPNRRNSDEDGLIVFLCPQCHRHRKEAAHNCAETADALHRYGEELWMIQTGGNKDDFIIRYGKNYLSDEELAEVYGHQDDPDYGPDYRGQKLQAKIW